MKSIEVTQFIPPNGEQRPVFMTVPDEYGDKVGEIHKAGCRLTVERLGTGEISLCIEDACGDFDCEIIEEGPGIRESIYAMLDRFSVTKLEAFRNAQCA